MQLALAQQLIAALAAMHASNVVHGAVCPAHAFLAPDTPSCSSSTRGIAGDSSTSGQKVFRLGGFVCATPLVPPALSVPVAKLDAASSLPAHVAPYTAPERWDRGAQLTARADVFAYGATLFHCLTGKLPHKLVAGRVEATRKAGDAGSRIGVPDKLFHLLAECMRVRATARPAAAAVQKRLDMIVTEASTKRLTAKISRLVVRT